MTFWAVAPCMCLASVYYKVHTCRHIHIYTVSTIVTETTQSFRSIEYGEYSINIIAFELYVRVNISLVGAIIIISRHCERFREQYIARRRVFTDHRWGLKNHSIAI